MQCTNAVEVGNQCFVRVNGKLRRGGLKPLTNDLGDEVLWILHAPFKRMDRWDRLKALGYMLGIHL